MPFPAQQRVLRRSQSCPCLHSTPSPEDKDGENAVLRDQLALIRRQVARPRFTATRSRRARDAAAARALGRVPCHARDVLVVAQLK